MFYSFSLWAKLPVNPYIVWEGEYTQDIGLVQLRVLSENQVLLKIDPTVCRFNDFGEPYDCTSDPKISFNGKVVPVNFEYERAPKGVSVYDLVGLPKYRLVHKVSVNGETSEIKLLRVMRQEVLGRDVTVTIKVKKLHRVGECN